MSDNNHNIDHQIHGSPSTETNLNESIVKNAEAFSSSVKVLNQFISHFLNEMKVKSNSSPVNLPDLAKYDMFVLETLVIKTMICLDGCLSIFNENSLSSPSSSSALTVTTTVTPTNTTAASTTSTTATTTTTSTTSSSTSSSNTSTPPPPPPPPLSSASIRRETDAGWLQSQKSLNEARANAAQILPNIIQLIELFFHQIRWTILNYLPLEDENLKNVRTLQAYDSLLRMTTVKAVGKLGPFAMSIVNYLPKSLLEAVDKWNTIQLDSNLSNSSVGTVNTGNGTSGVSSSSLPTWRKEFTSSALPSEAFAFSLQNFHFSALTSSYSCDDPCFITENANLKHVTSTLLKAAEEILLWTTAGSSVHLQSQLKEDFAKILIPLGLDLTLESFNNYCNQSIENIWGSRESDEFLCANYIEALHHSFDILTEHSQFIDEKISIECVKLIESLLEASAGQSALEKFFCDMDSGEPLTSHLLSSSSSSTTTTSSQGVVDTEFKQRDNRGIVSLITSASSKNLSSAYSSRILKFLVKLFEITEKNADSISLVRLCSSLTHLRNFTPQENEKYLQAWLNKLFCIKSDSLGEFNFSLTAENRLALQSLTSYIVKENSTVDEEVAGALLSALIPIASIVLSSSLDAKGFPDLLSTMTTLASAGLGTGHFDLVRSVFGWLDVCSKYLSQKDVLEKLENNVTSGRHQIIIESTCYMLSYLSDVFEAFKLFNNCGDNTSSSHSSSVDRPCSPLPTEESTSGIGGSGGGGTGSNGAGNIGDLEAEWVDDLTCLDDDESAGDESDEDSLCNKLCTFTITLKNFMNQHWYHCHTCKLVDGVGVCTVCAKVCHKDHDVTFSKYGSFFCDCGAKQDGSCLALTKRTPHIHDDQSTAASYRLPAYSCSQDPKSSCNGNGGGGSSSRRRTSSPDGDCGLGDELIKRQISSENQARYQVLARQLQSRKKELLSLLTSRNVGSTILDLLNVTVPSIIKNCQANSSIGCSIRAKKSLKDLHEKPKSIEFTDQLMVPTLGSQEGAFENVRLSYSGEQGQAIRQLISTNVIRRVAMCALVSPFGKRQHLAVSHEKGKITLLQLSALLKQADCAKKKFTLSRLASAPIPFTVLSMASNPCNEDFLSVCGLKDCHVLTFNPNGNVSGHLLLHPMLEAGNYLIKSIWLPGTQTELAIITMDFVKVYNLSVDVISPQFFFLLPSGKIRDVTFVITDNQRHILIISSAGHIYSQILSDESSARHGPFYVTNVVDVKHSEVRETSGGHINSGGVSIYYSHMLQLLFLSYANGKSFVTALTEVTTEITHLFVIETSNPNNSTTNGTSSSSSSSSATSGGNNNGNNGSGSGGGGGREGSKSGSSSSPTSSPIGPQPLCQWSEIHGHPGLVCAICQQSNNPVVFMIKTESFIIQEIQFISMKSKITDMVPVRHTTSSGELRTTLILLCEDGSLRIYMASPEATNFWLRPSLCSALTYGPGLPAIGLKSSKKVKSSKPVKHQSTSSSSGITSGPGGTISFPVDFFEHCTLLTDIEFGGNDVLQVYNIQQLKNRLNATGMYIASTKLDGFTIEVTNNDPTMVICGLRLFLGTQDRNKIPSYIEIFGRPIHVDLTRNRWYDFPLTREESLMADRKLNIFFGVSGDSNNITMVDSIKVYGKTKEVFAWPDEEGETSGGGITGGVNCSSTSLTESIVTNVSDFDIMSLASPYATALSSLDRLLSCVLEVLDGSFTLGIVANSTESRKLIHKQALEIVTNLLTYPFPVPVHQNIKYLLLTLHQNKTSFNNHRDAAILNYVIKSLSEANRAGELDGEAFYRLIILTKSIAISRPENLIKFSECLTLAMTQSENQHQQRLLSEDNDDFNDLSSSKSCSELLSSRAKSIEGPSKPNRPSISGGPPQRSVSFVESVHSREMSGSGKSGDSFLIYLSDTFWKLYVMRPKNPLLTSIAASGLVHVEATVQVLVEIILAFTLVDVSNIGTASQLLMKLFLCKNPVISFGARQSLIRLLSPKVRKRKAPTTLPSSSSAAMASASIATTSTTCVPGTAAGEPKNSTSGPESSNSSALPGSNVAGRSSSMPPDNQPASLDNIDPFEQQLLQQRIESICALHRAAASGIIDAPLLEFADVDDQDDPMAELAIVSSLQEQAAAARGLSVIEQSAASSSGGQSSSQRGGSIEDRSHYSDTTASAAGSDDEGSTAATDGSTLRTSPVANEVENVADGGGSESGASGVESVIGEHGASGRSSTYGDDATTTTTNINKGQPRDSAQETGSETVETDKPDSTSQKLHNIRLYLLEKLVNSLSEIRGIGGIHSIPMMQVIVMLSSDLDCHNEKDKSVFVSLLNALITELHHNCRDVKTLIERTPENEVKLIIMRLLSILMTQMKSSSSKSSSSHHVHHQQIEGGSSSSSSSSFGMCSLLTAQSLLNSETLDLCLQTLVNLKDYWKNVQPDHETSSSSSSSSSRSSIGFLQPGGTIGTPTTTTPLKPRNITPVQDMSPFFLKQFVKGHSDDIFATYPQLLTEMVLKLPYQIKKISNAYSSSSSSSSSSSTSKQITFPHAWLDVLCEYMMIQLAPMIRKQVRKLLNFICGSKEKYRQVRDFHALEYHFNEIKKVCLQGGFIESSDPNNESSSSSSSSSGGGNQGVIISLTYDSTIVLIEHLKACCDIASSRTLNWQKFCRNASVLTFFMQVSFLLDEGVSPIFLQLLQYALCRPTQPSTSSSSIKPPEGGIKVPVTILQGGSSVSSSTTTTVAGPSSSSSSSAASTSMATVTTPNTSHTLDIVDAAAREQANLAALLAQQFITQLDRSLLNQFIQCFLLESNSSSLRLQTHSLIFNMYKSIDDPAQHKILLDILWSLWDKVPCYGRKAGQFVDLLAYFTLRSNAPGDKEIEFRDKALAVLRQQNKLLLNHPNSAIYNSLQNLVEFDGYYLESEPCLVCNNPEVGYSNMKLSSVKVDSRFTTTTQIVKLVGSHTISKIALRIADIKRSKMVKTLIIFYNNRSVHSVVELKNRTSIWHKAKKCQLASGQTDVKIEFPLPIVACNLMIEYSDFYENIQASSETLQCPRCSASVPANPGVCGNCGENVFQCHKCRSINYDEKDPFLCNSCGFSKYAKFDYTLTAKPTFSVDPIENEEDRKKTVQTINTLLEKADRVYKGLIANKPTLELLLLRIQEHGFMDKMSDEALGIVPSGSGYPSSTGPINVPAANSSGHVNRAIQQVAHKYCVECKGSFDELSKIIQKVLASRKELVDYDNVQRDSITTKSVKPIPSGGGGSKGSATRRDSKFIVSLSSASGRCYGCACAVVELCITLLKALGTQLKYRRLLCSSGLLKQLVDYNLRTGGSSVRQEVRQLLVTLTLDNPEATEQLNDMLMYKIIASLVSPSSMRHDLTSSIRHEIALLICSLEREDSCWEKRLRCVLRLFRVALSYNSPSVLESITLPCLKLLINLIKPDSFISKKNKDKTIEQMAGVTIRGAQISIDLNKWLAEDEGHSFAGWKKRCAKRCISLPVLSGTFDKGGKSKEIVRSLYLMEKYGNRWKENTLDRNRFKVYCKLAENTWLRSVLFNKFSRTVRLMACSLVGALFQTPSRRKELIDILTRYLDELGMAREYSQEFFTLYHNLIRQDHWKYYLALKGVLLHLGSLITEEIEKLNELEETTLNSDLSEGCALKMLVDLLTVFVDVPSIRKQYKSRLVAFILNGYLSLRKLVVQRTKTIDETQDNLLELLEEMTTGTESETSSFMAVCVEAVNKCKLDDLRTPVFIFERLCSIIYPEENDTSEFFINLEKDPQHEDFLQGRMLGNPYPSTEPGMGPLMRDIKNKICQDCELIALLEDDSGMELLVCNKIISLDLPVEEVYKKIWLIENSETEAMRVIYRMRGLMGDATEEFIQTLDSKNNENVDAEQVFKMANVMSECGGLEVLLQRLAVIQDLSARSRPLLLVLLKLFDYCVKVRQNRQALINPSLKAVNVLLSTLKMAIIADSSDLASCLGGGFSSTGKPNVLEMILVIMENILVEASKQSREEYDRFYHETCGTKDDVKFLLNAAEHENVRHNTNVMHILMKVTPLLTLGDKEKMLTLLDHFRPHLNFNKFDFDHTPENDFRIDCFCVMLHGIEKNENGNRLKDFILNEDIVSNALAYLKIHAPAVKSALLATSEEWKEFTQRPALKYVLRLLTGLCSGHPSSQMLVAAESIPVIHGLEQVSSDSHVGSLAEMLLEALKYQNSVVSEKIEHVRKQTKEEKKKLAMAVRQKQLGELGMKANERGQVMAKSSILRQVEDLGEEQGLSCIICREGYKFQPSKVLGIYTFTKECPIEPFELKSRKTMGYSTVTHFNVVHVDCHMAAVRHARGRDEWESAALQNASTKCNGLLPLWGPSVQESAFASCLARHNTYLQECTGHRDISYPCTIHDLKLLLLRFAGEESFSLDSGGGGPQSNIHLIPYIIHMALYVINTTRCAARESKKVTASFLDLPPSKWVENSYESESPFYWTALSLVIHPPTFWKKHRSTFLKRLLITAQARQITPKGANHLIDNRSLDYSVYKTSLLFFALIDSIYSIMFKSVLPTADETSSSSGISCETWTLALAEYIRNNDQLLLENGDKLLRFYEQDLLPCQSFYELIDVLALHHLVPDPDTYLDSCFRIPLN